MKIVYAYDALCGWCYGFSPVIEKFYQQYKENFSFEVLSGGMVTGPRIGPIGQVAGYIEKAYQDVEQITGVKFGDAFLYNILKEGSAVFTSVPPALAMSVFKSFDPEQSILFARAIQQAIYYDGLAPEDFEGYGKLAQKFNLESTTFIEKMKTDKYLEKVQQDFKKTSQLGVSGFPTLFLEDNGKHTRIVNGYVDYPKLDQIVQSLFHQ
ncbi:MAG: DsbA family protein [Candidatus Cyclobacteriaceae bacterium M3_2C_046]